MNNKVRDLISILQTLNQDAEIELEGCDCYGEWNGSAEQSASADGSVHVSLYRYFPERDTTPPPPQYQPTRHEFQYYLGTIESIRKQLLGDSK